ncbi:MAG: hypothetical protein VX944_10355, partial [Myxococcota bacterium]|nr:hypothetical protein [Myxococcota bacterium]
DAHGGAVAGVGVIFSASGQSEQENQAMHGVRWVGEWVGAVPTVVPARPTRYYRTERWPDTGPSDFACVVKRRTGWTFV